MALGIQYIWLAMMPKIFFLVCIILATFVYIGRNNERWSGFRRVFSFSRLIFAVIGFRIAYATLLTASQYFTWASGGIGTFFLNAPVSKSVPVWFVQKLPWVFESRLGYFIFYSFGRFWLNVILSIVVAWIFYRFLILLKRYKERFFEDNEVKLGFLVALLAGWPVFTILIPLIFISVVIVSLFRLVIFKEVYTTLGWPFILAAFLSIIFGSFLLVPLHLSVLSV